MAVTEDGAGAAWEQGLEETWRSVELADDGTLNVEAIQTAHRKRLRRLRDGHGAVRRGMIRNVVVVFDASLSMAQIDLRPRRIDCVVQALPSFVTEFFSQNPISHMALLETRDGRCHTISSLSGSKKRQLSAVALKRTMIPRGEASLQNSLSTALRVLTAVPAHASREVIIIYGSLSTCDPGDIFATIDELKEANVRCSVIHLAAAVRVCEHLCRETGGSHGVVLDESHFKELLMQHCVPPPVIQKLQPTLLPMGFPKLKLDGATQTHSYFCPRCGAKHSELPTECRVCALHLVSAPHIARSYHHLFPVKAFSEVPISATGFTCFGCELFMSRAVAQTAKSSAAYKCVDCNQIFCFDCDFTVHEVVHNCPGCTILND